VEFVDIYPTLCQMAGLNVPSHCQGKSFVPVLDAPERAWKKAAFSQFVKRKPREGAMLGTSIRTERFRFTQWRNRATGELDAEELFDFQADPKATKNVIDMTEYASFLPELRSLCKQSGSGVE
jgi:iduronate 2-sulfatase